MPFQRLPSQNAAPAARPPIPAYVAYTWPRSASARRRRKARARDGCERPGKAELRIKGRVRERRSRMLLSWRARMVVSGERDGGGVMDVVVVVLDEGGVRRERKVAGDVRIW